MSNNNSCTTNSDSNIKVVILGAGSSLKKDIHPALHVTNGKVRVLDWLLQAVNWLSPKLMFVGGYHIEEIANKYPELSYFINPKWHDNGPVASFLMAKIEQGSTYYITYADIVFRESLVKKMEDIDADIVVAADSKWRNRFEGRTFEDMVRCEKLNICQSYVTRLSPQIDVDLADAEYVGFVKFSSKAIELICNKLDVLKEKLKNSRISELVEFLRVYGLTVKAVDVAGDWAELNDSQDLARFILGTKAQTLQRLQKVVTKSRIEDQVSFSVREWCLNSQYILKQIQNLFCDQLLVVRSSALSEDGFVNSNAGAYKSVLSVDVKNKSDLNAAIEKVIASYTLKNQADQVLVQPMVENVTISGVVFSRSLTYGAPYYVINYDDVSTSTASITSGASNEHKTLIIYKNCSNLCLENLPMDLKKLIDAIVEIEEILLFDALDVEFAINSEGEVYVFQVRPLTCKQNALNGSEEEIAMYVAAAKAKYTALQHHTPFIYGEKAVYGIMPDWNPAEIIGTKPGRLAIGLYRYLILDEIWATQRCEYGYRDVRPQPLLTVFAGQPYVDVRASFNSFIPNTVPENLANKLVNFYLDWLIEHPQLHDKVEFEVVPTCFDLDFQRWAARFLTDGLFSESEIDELKQGLKYITKNAFNRPEKDLAAIHLLEKRFECIIGQKMAPLDRAIVLLEDCRRYGTLSFSHLARSAFVAVTLLRSAVRSGVMSAETMEMFLNSIRTVAHEFTEDIYEAKHGNLKLSELVKKYGHLRPGTYDVTSLKYADDPDMYFKPLIKRATNCSEHKFDRKTWDKACEYLVSKLNEEGFDVNKEGIERFLRNAIEGREYAKFIFTKNLSTAIDSLVDYGKQVGLEREDLFNISIEDFIGIRSGTISTSNEGAWLKLRSAEGVHARNVAIPIELPPLITSIIDFDLFHYPNTHANFIGNGRILTDCVDLAKYTPENMSSVEGKIVLISQADPGYDWLFGQGIGGLITCYGGANSHMAIRAAEFGLPAAIGVGESKYRQLIFSTVLELDAGNKNIRIIQ